VIEYALVPAEPWRCGEVVAGAGARAGVRARNREALYTLSRAFERRGGKRARRGDGAAADPALAAAAGSDPAPHGGPSEAAELAQPGANSGRAAKTALEPDAAEAAGAGAAACEAASGAGAAQPAAPSGAVGAGGERGAAADACDGAAPAPRKAKGRKRREEAAQGAAGAAPAGSGASDVPESKPGRKRKGAPARVRGVDGHLEVVLAAGSRDAAAAKAKRKHVSASVPGSAGAAQASGAPAQAAATQLGEPASGERGAASADGAASLPAPSQIALGERAASAKPASGAAAPLRDESGKKKKKRKSGQAAVPAAGAAQAGGTPAGPALIKKRMKRGTVEKASAGAMPGAGGVQGADGAMVACRTAPAARAAGSGGAEAAAAAAAAAQTKRVKFALSRNLAHSFGGQVPPADVRTPPGAQPKGSALKAGAAAGSGKGFRRLSAPGRLGGPDAEKRSKGQSRLGAGSGGSAVRRLAARSPKAIPRAQAAQFF